MPIRNEATPPALTGSTSIPSGGGNWANRPSIAARRSASEIPGSAVANTGAQYWARRKASSPPTDWVVDTASSKPSSRLRVRSSNASPASVSSTRWVERRSRSHPISFSSELIWRLSADCEMCRRSAAREKLSSSATATKARRWRSSIASGACGKARTLAPSVRGSVGMVRLWDLRRSASCEIRNAVLRDRTFATGRGR